MHLRPFSLFIIVVFIGIPVVFATLLLFAPFMAFDQQADMATLRAGTDYGDLPAFHPE